jgi:ribonuclease Z
LGYFLPNYQIIVKEVSDGDVIKFDGYTIKAFRVRHTVPTLAYCLEEDQRPGRFDKERALSLGIPEGHLFSKLQQGESVEIKGKKIFPEMVLGKPRLGRKITISGDTIPCDGMIDFAKGSDVLIHDGTFADDFKDRANKYGHSTARQAALIAKKAGVGKLFLVHISPRYKDGMILEREAREIFENSFVARDLMEIEVRLKK